MGRELASLIALAKRDGGLVVRSAPVSKLGSFLEEKVDMAGHMPVLADTLSVFSFLARDGKVEARIRANAEPYLRQVDQGWGTSPSIDTNTILD